MSHNERRQRVDELNSALPESLGFHVHELDDLQYELRSDRCIIKVVFDRYDPSSTMIELAKPDVEDGMAYWILRHIRGVPATPDEESSLRKFGTKLADKFGDVLQGDFAIALEYDEFSNRILDRMFEVRSLPQDHPTRKLFDQFDLQWLHDLEGSSSV